METLTSIHRLFQQGVRMKAILCVFSLFLVAGCGDDSDAPTGPAEAEFDFGPILSNFTDNVVIATYADLDERAGELLATIEALSSDTTPENLSAARNAWVATRIPWEASEGFPLWASRFQRLRSSARQLAGQPHGLGRGIGQRQRLDDRVREQSGRNPQGLPHH